MSLTTWRKSSFSSDPDDNCVEVAFAVTGVALRDSKNTAGPTMAVDLTGWQAFTATLSR